MGNLQAGYCELVKSIAAVQTWATDKDWPAIQNEAGPTKTTLFNSTISAVGTFVQTAKELHDLYSFLSSHIIL